MNGPLTARRLSAGFPETGIPRAHGLAPMLLLLGLVRFPIDEKPEELAKFIGAIEGQLDRQYRAWIEERRGFSGAVPPPGR